MGSSDDFTLEIRGLHAILGISIVLLLTVVPINSVIGLDLVIRTIVLAIIGLIVVYTLSRVYRLHTTAILVYALGSYGLMTFNFFANSGSSGPTLFLFFLTFQLLIATTTEKHQWVWVWMHLAVPSFLLTFEFMMPNIIPVSYENPISRYFDLITNYLVSIVFIYFITFYLRHNLDTENRNLIQQQLLEQTRSTTAMLNNLVTWSKGQMQGMKAHPKPFSPISVLEEIVKLHDPIAQHKGIAINIHTNTDHKIYADPDMISIALRNLINNAIKFTRNNGSVDVYIESADNRLIIKINDNGVGIKKEEASKLLTCSATATYGTNNEKGMGLGLLLAKEYIEVNDGNLNFQSDYGKGTTFKVCMPMVHTEIFQ